MMRGGDQTSRILYELCALILALLRHPHLTLPPSWSSAAATASAVAAPPPELTARRARAGPSQRPQPTVVSPAALASLMLGVSMALMFCGSITFFIGFMLMPWVLGMLTVFYLAGVVSNISGIGRAFFFSAGGGSSPPGSGPSTPRVSRKEVQEQPLSKFTDH